MSRSTQVYIISVAAEMTGMHPQTLRSYDRIGLVRPGRTVGLDRRYSDEDIERLQHVRDLAQRGVNLAGIQEILRLEERVRELEELLETPSTRRTTPSYQMSERERNEAIKSAGELRERLERQRANGQTRRER